MQQIGVRELKARASEILRRVQENDETYEITHRGKVVARLSPAWYDEGPELSKEYAEQVRRWIAEGDRIAEEIAKLNLPSTNAVEIMREERR